MPSDARWDDEDMPAAASEEGFAPAGLEALDPYTPIAPNDSEDTWISWQSAIPVDHTDGHPMVLFTVTSPTGALSATATLGGRLQRVDVFNLSGFDEARLGEEIQELATLAKEKARAAQREVIVELMRNLGHDRVSTGAFLQQVLGWPSLEAANSQLAEAWAARRGIGDS